MRTVIYARFSSDHQNPRSTADQIAVCRERVEREGWSVVGVFEDAATSGAAGIGEDQRPGLNAMLRLVEAGGIDQVLAESTDRVSRHVADAHMIRERIEFAGARLFTLFDGTVTPMVALVKGFTDAQFRTDLAARVRRGQRGTIAQGRAASGIAYGYRIANRLDERGQLIAGLREIDPEKADIVRRIYREYASGRSARSIAAQLNAEGVPGPRRSYWNLSSINGHKATNFGILRNPIYIGKLVYGRSRTVINPQTRRKMMRPNKGETPFEQYNPDLRIIDDEQWDAVQLLMEKASRGPPERQRRPKHMLSGLGVCEKCGSNWIKVDTKNWGCSRNRNGVGACDNNRVIATNKYEKLVLADLKTGMLAPDAIAAYLREYHRNFAAQSSQLAADRGRIERKLAEATRRMDRMMQAFASGGSEFAEIRDMLASARDEKERLTRELASIDAMPEVIALHPRLEVEYRRQVEDLDQALRAPEAQLEAIPRLRAMIARIVVRPSPTGRGVELEVVRQIDEILSLATTGELRTRAK